MIWGRLGTLPLPIKDARAARERMKSANCRKKEAVLDGMNVSLTTGDEGRPVLDVLLRFTNVHLH